MSSFGTDRAAIKAHRISQRPLADLQILRHLSCLQVTQACQRLAQTVRSSAKACLSIANENNVAKYFFFIQSLREKSLSVEYKLALEALFRSNARLLYLLRREIFLNIFSGEVNNSGA